MVVPAGTQHQFVNTGPTPLVCLPSPKIKGRDIGLFRCTHLGTMLTGPGQILYTIYSPAEHDPRTVHKTKKEGDEEEEAGKDEAPKWSRQSQAENEKAGLVNTSGKY